MQEAAVLYDISPAISPELAVWPGDTPPAREVLADMQRGDSLTLSTLRATVHLGAHADAPSHYGVDAASIEQCALERYIGRCQVMRVPAAARQALSLSDLPEPVVAPRVLIATGTRPDPARFNRDFAALSPDLVDHLHATGVVLVGVDTPSVDLFDSEDLPVHHAFLRNDMAIVEGLQLADVPTGIYELIALPLKLVGFEGSPVRAVLRALTP